MFGFKPLLGLEPMAPIRPQLLVSHANHSATETSMYVCPSVRPPAYLPACLSVYVRTYIYTRTHMICIYLRVFLSIFLSLYLHSCLLVLVRLSPVCQSVYLNVNLIHSMSVWVCECGCVSVGVV